MRSKRTLRVSVSGLLVSTLAACGVRNSSMPPPVTTPPPITTAPAITTQPANASVVIGNPATFMVVASGTAPLSYQWEKNGKAVTGATTANYTVAAATLGDNGSMYDVMVNNAAGSTKSDVATLTVTTPPTAPAITTQPANASLVIGNPATFTVVASGTAPLSYQWEKNGKAVTGATTANYTVAAATLGDNGSMYDVIVKNAAGSTKSDVATLTVTASAPNDVATFKNDRSRSGQNLAETTLTLANVNSASFGLLHTVMVDGKVDAQPLYLSQVPISGTAHNVAFVATEHGSVYAIDADAGTPIWQISVLAAGETPSDTHGCGQVTPRDRHYLDAGHRSDRRPARRAVCRRDVDRQVVRLSPTPACARHHHGRGVVQWTGRDHRQCSQQRGNVDFRCRTV